MDYHVIIPRQMSYLQATLDYQSRVQADSGTVVSLDSIDAAYQLISAQSLSPAAWWAADFGYKDAGSSKVSKLYDLSSNNNDAAQTTDASRPVWTDSKQNSKPGLVYSAAQKLSFTAVGALTIVAAVNKDAVSNKGCIVGLSSDAARSIILGLASSGNDTDRANVSGATDALSPSGGVTTARVVSFRKTQVTGGTLYLARNGTFGSGVGQQITKSSSFNMLGSWTSATYHLDGDIYEICLFTTDLDTTARQAIENYMMTKWGIS